MGLVVIARNPAVLALADDATGALETGAQFAAQGIETMVSFRGAPGAFPATPAAVIDTETRHAPARQARNITRSWTLEARRRGIGRLYKKTDSTLRGNIAAEFEGMREAFPEAALVYVPAYPKLSRRVRGGRLYLGELPLTETHFARDPRNPVREDRIPELLACGARSVEAGTLRQQLSGDERCVLVCDAETDQDLQSIAAVLRDCVRPLIVAGPGGFAGVWAGSLAMPRSAPPEIRPALPCLAVNGSLHPLSLTQARRAGCMPHEIWTASASEIAAEIQSNGFAVLTTTERMGSSSLAIGRLLASTARAVLHAAAVRTLAIFGGDTAIAILDEFGIACVQPLGELRDGAPASRIRIDGRDITLITKAGGFGGAGTLEDIRKMLEKA